MTQDEALLRLKAAQLALGGLELDGDPRTKFNARVEELRKIAWPKLGTVPVTKFVAAKSKVLNRGVPPDAFLNELVAWGKSAPDEIFAENAEDDVYGALAKELGPYESMTKRRAVMLEALRVLGGFESSWDWTEGRDTTNPNRDKPENEEAGIFQTSFDSVAFHPSLRACMLRFGALTAQDFIRLSKSNHPFAMEYTARLLRFTVRHHGPLKRREVNEWVRPEAVEEFRVLLA